VFAALGLPRILISRLSVVGVGGAVTTVPVDAKLHLFRDTGGPVALNGPFLAFTDPDALDISVLGRDLLNHFALIVDWPSQTICLLNQNHRYAITSV